MIDFRHFPVVAVFILAGYFSSFAQVNAYPCATDAFRNHLRQQRPELAGEEARINRRLRDLAVESRQSGRSIDTTHYTIPVAFHIIYNDPSGNVPDSLIYDAIDHLNDGFANQGFYDPNTGVPIYISFCLANKGKNGEPSTGIERISDAGFAFLDEWEDDAAMKARYFWPTDKVLNIYSVENITFATAYATFPDLEEGNFQQGIVIDAPFLGFSELRSTVLIHEVGHFLGLYHTFQDNCRNFDCLMQGDRVCDTPPDAIWTVMEGCQQENNNCFSDADDTSADNPFKEDGPDQNSNYMDYNVFACQNEFTPGQRLRMRFAAIELRPKLLGSDYCSPDLAYDVQPIDIAQPEGELCGETSEVRVRILNQGTETVTRLSFQYGFAGEREYTYSWEGQLPAEGLAWVDLPAIPNPDAGRHSFAVRTEWPNGLSDQLPGNDTLRSEAYSPFAGFVPYVEDFESGMPSDLILRNTPFSTWNLATCTYEDAALGENEAIFLRNDYYRRPLPNEFVTPVLNLAGHRNTRLNFEYAFRLQSADNPLNANLTVQVRPVCAGVPPTDFLVLEKNNLPTTNLNDDSYTWVPESIGDWTRETLDLSEFDGEKVTIHFISDFGYLDMERLYLDNIEVSSDLVDEKAVTGITAEEITIFPNPNAGQFTVQVPMYAAGLVEMKIYDVRGRLMRNDGESAGMGLLTRRMDLPGLAPGLYYLQVVIGEQRFVKKVLIQN
jgi:hypothetical protein